MLRATIIAADRRPSQTPVGGRFRLPSSSGRYELDGYSIRLQFDDGSTRGYAFCLYPKDDAHFVIGVSHFTPLN